MANDHNLNRDYFVVSYALESDYNHFIVLFEEVSNSPDAFVVYYKSNNENPIRTQ
jgi:hypothetical protein